MRVKLIKPIPNVMLESFPSKIELPTIITEWFEIRKKILGFDSSDSFRGKDVLLPFRCDNIFPAVLYHHVLLSEDSQIGFVCTSFKPVLLIILPLFFGVSQNRTIPIRSLIAPLIHKILSP
jgi:hypothetical protein